MGAPDYYSAMDMPFSSVISRQIWDAKYRLREGEQTLDSDIPATWRRVARALAGIETHGRDDWEQSFGAILQNFRFLPGGRILAGAGSSKQVTLFNCFVMGNIEDSMDGIFEALKEGAITMQQGGGVGYDFSTLRPAGSSAGHSATIASGPVSFMDVWDSMCATVLSTGARRGAMMATLRCDHPDIEQFISAKREPGRLRRFNLSVQVTDPFMNAVRADQDWPLVFPAEAIGGHGEIVVRDWPGFMGPVACRVLKRVKARGLWDRIMVSTYDFAEPGVLFIDRINRNNNLYYREHITATNPCGEIPLPPYGACDLGSINVTRLIRDPFTAAAKIDEEELRATVKIAARLMDNVIDVSRFPLPRQAEQARGTRRIGMGITGLADALVMLGLRYDSADGRSCAASIMRIVCHTAYMSSVETAREKGAFPFFEREKYLAGEFVQTLPEEIKAAIADYGIRNSHLTAIAPTGTISLFADNVSSGLEPIFDLSYRRSIIERDGSRAEHDVDDYAYALWREQGGTEVPGTFVTAHGITPEDHLAMQAALQPYIDNSISKTINIPVDYPFEQFRELYGSAYAQGLKGCTTFRPNPVTGSILTTGVKLDQATPCCGLEREGD